MMPAFKGGGSGWIRVGRGSTEDMGALQLPFRPRGQTHGSENTEIGGRGGERFFGGLQIL